MTNELKKQLIMLKCHLDLILVIYFIMN